jgi:glyoxylase-like metal-dependent hydrolase (beta-lactamase superfamily II)
MGASANITFFVGGEAVLVVDSGNSPDLGTQTVAMIRKVTDKPLKYLVLTHYHPDHVSGAESFPSSTLIISHKNTRDSIPSQKRNTMDYLDKLIGDLRKDIARLQSENSPRLAESQKELERRIAQKDDWSRRKIAMPDLVIENDSTIYLGESEVDLIYLGPGHTNGDLIVGFPSEKAIHVGDLFFLNGWVPRLDADAGASVDNWMRIFDKLKKMDFQTVIPGHGEPASKAGFLGIAQMKMDYLIDLKAEVQKFVDQGFTLDQIKGKVKLSKYEKMELYEPLLPYNIEGAYKEIIAHQDLLKTQSPDEMGRGDGSTRSTAPVSGLGSLR